MSDPRTANIKRTLAMLGAVWMEFPHLRLGQLIENIQPVDLSVDLYNITDTKMRNLLAGYLSELTESES